MSPLGWFVRLDDIVSDVWIEGYKCRPKLEADLWNVWGIKSMTNRLAIARNLVTCWNGYPTEYYLVYVGELEAFLILLLQTRRKKQKPWRLFET